MAFSSCQERKYPNFRGTITPRRMLDGKLAAPYTVEYVAKADQVYLYMDSVQDALLKYLKSQGIKTPGEDSSDGFYTASRLTVEQMEVANGYYWTVRIEFEPNPIKILSEVQFQTSHYEEEALFDKNGSPVLNKAGRPYARGITVQRGRLRLEVTRRFAINTFDPGGIKNAIYHKNATAVNFLYPPGDGRSFYYAVGELYCTDIRAPVIAEPKLHFCVTAGFEVDPIRDDGAGGTTGGWKQRPLNVSDQVKNDSGQLVLPTLRGVAHGQGVPIDANGKQLAEGATPIKNEHDCIPDYDFNQLKIFPGQ